MIPTAVWNLSPLLIRIGFAGKAGFVRRVTLIKEIRKQDKDLLLFDCGDFSQGSPFIICLVVRLK